MTDRTRALIEVHVATFLYGFIGLLGKAVSLTPHEIVFWRTFLAAIVLYAIARRLSAHSGIRSRKDLLTFGGIAALLSIHWILFFQAIKVSTVAIALVTTYAYPIVMVLLEGWFFRVRLRSIDFVSAVLALVGIYYLVPSFDLSDANFQGVVYGVAAGLIIPFIILARKKYIIGRYNSWDISAYEMGLVSLILLPIMLLKGSFDDYPGARDLMYLIVLGVLLTGFARVLFVKSQSHLSGKVVGLTIVLEIVYGVILAMLFISAIPTHREIVGGLIVVCAVLFENLRSKDVNSGFNTGRSDE